MRDPLILRGMSEEPDEMEVQTSSKKLKKPTLEYDDTPETIRMRGVLNKYNELLNKTRLDVFSLEEPYFERSEKKAGKEEKFFRTYMSDVSAYGSKQRYLLRECFWLIVITEEWTMRKTPKSPGEKIVKDIKRATRKHYSSEEKIRIVLDGLRGEDSIAELCRREGIAQGIYYKWSKDFMEAGKKRLAGDTARSANTDEVKELRREAKDLKEVVAEQTLELRLLKKSMYGGGGDHE